MFALEISFKGEQPTSETIFIRRPTALIGARESAHVLIDDMAALGYCILITRDVGRSFRLSPISEGGNVYTPQFLDGVYDGETIVDLGPCVLHLIALDTDLLPREAEVPDRAGIRVLRQACAGHGPKYPALLVVSQPPATISFAPDQPLLIGRSRQCSLRLDTSSISARHARVGYESGQFWVEDLGSTNGVFVNRQQISGRVDVAPGTPISLGRDVTFVGILSQEEVSQALAAPEVKGAKPVHHEKRYPLLISLSETARPAQVVLSPGSQVVMGRDPSSEMWLGVPHVSRRHCAVEVSMNGLVRVTDRSTNGTGYDRSILRKDETIEVSDKPMVLDFGGGVTVGICFSEKDEERFIAAGGSPDTFIVSDVESAPENASKASKRNRKRSRTTFLRAPDEVKQAVAAVKGRGALTQLYGRLSGKGRLVMAMAIVGMVGVASLIGGLLVAGLR
jgi:pSer/pThr/pTyr-binding forkhead associated (FHA) protein